MVRGLGVDHGVPRSGHVEPGEDQVGVRDEEPGKLGVELLARAPLGHGPRALNTADAVGDLDELRQLCQPGRNRDLGAGTVTRPPAAVPLLVGRTERCQHSIGEAELLGQRSGECRMLGESSSASPIRSASRNAIRHCRSTCSIGCPKPRSTPSDCHELCQPDLHAVGPVGHARSVLPLGRNSHPTA